MAWGGSLDTFYVYDVSGEENKYLHKILSLYYLSNYVDALKTEWMIKFEIRNYHLGWVHVFHMSTTPVILILICSKFTASKSEFITITAYIPKRHSCVDAEVGSIVYS